MTTRRIFKRGGVDPRTGKKKIDHYANIPVPDQEVADNKTKSQGATQGLNGVLNDDVSQGHEQPATGSRGSRADNPVARYNTALSVKRAIYNRTGKIVAINPEIEKEYKDYRRQVAEEMREQPSASGSNLAGNAPLPPDSKLLSQLKQIDDEQQKEKQRANEELRQQYAVLEAKQYAAAVAGGAEIVEGVKKEEGSVSTKAQETFGNNIPVQTSLDPSTFDIKYESDEDGDHYLTLTTKGTVTLGEGNDSVQLETEVRHNYVSGYDDWEPNPRIPLKTDFYHVGSDGTRTKVKSTRDLLGVLTGTPKP